MIALVVLILYEFGSLRLIVIVGRTKRRSMSLPRNNVEYRVSFCFVGSSTSLFGTRSNVDGGYQPKVHVVARSRRYGKSDAEIIRTCYQSARVVQKYIIHRPGGNRERTSGENEMYLIVVTCLSEYRGERRVHVTGRPTVRRVTLACEP